MNEQEILVTDVAQEEQVAENVEQTTEEMPKIYTEAEMNAKVDEILGKKIARKEAKIRKEYDRKYGQLEEVLKAGTRKESVEEITDTFVEFYRQKGVKLPERPNYTDKDIEVLARAEADDIISSGFDEVVEEVDRLADIGIENMTKRDKALFKTLAEHRQKTERSRELNKIGVTEDIYESKEFKDFASQFNPNISISDIYDIYAKTKPKKNITPMGSMKHSPADGGVKDYYSPEEIEKLTEDDLRDPKVWDAVRRSMTGR